MGGSLQIQPAHLGKASIQVKAESNRDALKLLVEADKNAGIIALTGVDLGAQIGLLYHIRTNGAVITLKSEVPKESPRIPTITDIIPGALFHEREAADLFGVVFEGHPNPARIVLPEDWSENLYPLRKDAKIDNATVKCESSKSKPEPVPPQSDGSLVNIIIGPQHPALLEPEKFSVKVNGEIVKQVEPRIGYVHRGVEKAAEQRTYLQDVYLVERICGICNSCHATCFVEAVEKILGTQVPPRAKYIRTIILELNRLHSHLLLLGHAGLEIGYETLFQYMWRDREPIMDVTELLTGNRVISSAIAVGGVRRDIRESDVPKIKAVLADLKKKMALYRQLYTNERTLKMRTQNVGTLSKEDAVKLCVVGPVARGSGVNIDVRKEEPYEAYGEIPFKLITYNTGDSWARFMVRIDEIDESISIIDYALDHLPAGPFRVRAPRVVAAGEAVNRVEAPRGELFYYVKSNGTAYPERVKVRTPTYANLPAFLKTAEGGNIADVPANFVSLDPCFSCTDR
ncbi:MAG: NADH-quinone oxidoreductase subunit C [Candidatus Bathyarchaeota archaeon]|nr:NADH-quinone oxidoreductase subunit C [Candidatus Bathyarchaeota archaeon]